MILFFSFLSSSRFFFFFFLTAGFTFFHRTPPFSINLPIFAIMSCGSVGKKDVQRIKNGGSIECTGNICSGAFSSPSYSFEYHKDRKARGVSKKKGGGGGVAERAEGGINEYKALN